MEELQPFGREENVDYKVRTLVHLFSQPLEAFCHMWACAKADTGVRYGRTVSFHLVVPSGYDFVGGLLTRVQMCIFTQQAASGCELSSPMSGINFTSLANADYLMT